MTRARWRVGSGVLSGCAAAVVLTALLLPGSGLANQCVYSDGNNDNGPCVEVRNELGGLGFQSMNLWCHNGPTPRSQKIVLRDWPTPDSFTCKGVAGAGTTVTIQRTKIGCDSCDLTYSCEGKIVLKLVKVTKGNQLNHSICAL